MWTREELSALKWEELDRLARHQGIQTNKKRSWKKRDSEIAEIIDKLITWDETMAHTVKLGVGDEGARAIALTISGPQGEERVEIWRAVISLNLPKLESLLREGINVNQFLTNAATPLHLAVKVDDWEAVHALLAAGAAVDAVLCSSGCARHETDSLTLTEPLHAQTSRDGSGTTPLHLAVNRKVVPIVWLLIDAGANVNLPNAVSLMVYRAPFLI